MEETISNDVKSHIIALVKSRENLWKVKTRSYKIDNKKAEDYQEVADEVNKLHGLSITGDQVRGVFKNLRDTYSRRIRNAKKDMKTTGSGAENTKTSKAKAQKEEAFPFLQEMEFLNENTNDLDTPRRILGGESQDLHVAVAQSPPENTISSTMDIESEERHPEHEELGHQARKRRKQLTHVEGELAQAVSHLAMAIAEDGQKDRMDTFASDVAASLRVVEERDRELALEMKKEIHDICYKYERRSMFTF